MNGSSGSSKNTTATIATSVDEIAQAALHLRNSKFELAVALTLFTWPDLTLAVQNNWGGPDSAAKREWFAGAVADLFTSLSPDATETPDAEDVEERLLQIMEDEFEVIVDDGSAEVVADQIVDFWGECVKGEFGAVEKLHEGFSKKQGQQRIVAQIVEESDGEDDDEDSVDGEEWDKEDEEGDVEMGDAPPRLVEREKPAPEIDEDGFMKVVSKRKGR